MAEFTEDYQGEIYECCDSIDAAIHTGTLLEKRQNREALQEYIDSWQRALNSQDHVPCITAWIDLHASVETFSRPAYPEAGIEAQVCIKVPLEAASLRPSKAIEAAVFISKLKEEES